MPNHPDSARSKGSQNRNRKKSKNVSAASSDYNPQQSNRNGRANQYEEVKASVLSIGSNQGRLG